MNTHTIKITGLFVFLFVTYPVKGEETSNQNLFSKFYDYAFPTQIQKPIYTEVFDPSTLTLKEFDLQKPDSRRAAFLASGKILPEDLQPHFLHLKETPNNSVIAHYIFREKERFTSYPAELREALSQIEVNFEKASPAEKFLLKRDMWNVLAAIRNFSRLYDRTETRQIHTVLRKVGIDLERKLNGSNFTEGAIRSIQAEINQPFSIEGLLNLTDELEIGRHLRKVTELENFEEVLFNPSWQHLEAFSGASMFRIWTWTDPAANPPEHGAMLVKTALMPKDARLNRVYEKFLVEEILISGVGGDQQSFFQSGQYPVHLRLVLNRDLFIERMANLGSNYKKSYLVKQNSEDLVFLGFLSDTVGVPPRGGPEIQTSTISCIDCHGGIGKRYALPLLNSMDRKPNQYTQFFLKDDRSVDIQLLPFYK